MPKYVYRCADCLEEWKLWRSMKDESAIVCSFCSSLSVVKIPSNIFLKKEIEEAEKEIGTITNEYIEENRKILKDMQRTAKEILEGGKS